MAKSTAARAEARFKQLCCLGLGREAVMPALLKELRTFIPSSFGHFFFAGPDGTLANAYVENPVRTQTYMELFHGKRDREIPGCGWPEAMRTQFGAHDLEDAIRVEKETFRRTDFFNLIFRPNQIDRFLRLVVREGGQGLGSTTLYRTGDRPWSAAEKRRLSTLEPFFAHALKGGTNKVVPSAENGPRGLIIANLDGKPVFMSTQGRRLLFLATHPRVTPDILFERLAALPPPVVRLCRNLTRIFSDDDFAAAPTCHHRNVWGGFTFRAEWLDDGAPTSGMIGITVIHHEPLSVRLVRQVGELPLSRRQAEVCMLMANGASNEKIAERLGISKHTAITHGRSIYNKLAVHNRTELLNRLLPV